MVEVNTTWPLLAGLFSEPEPFKQIVVHRFFALEPWPSRSQGETLLRLEGGVPLLVAHRYGRGYVTLFATSAERTWTNLPVKPVFLPILVRLATWGMKSDWLVYEAGQTVRIRPAVALQDEGQTAPVHSVSAGLDYPGVGPEHAHWKDTGRVTYTTCSDDEAIDAFCLLSKIEGIIPALESAHAVAEAIKVAPKMKPDEIILINLSGRGDKDCAEVARILKERKEKSSGKIQQDE